MRTTNPDVPPIAESNNNAVISDSEKNSFRPEYTDTMRRNNIIMMDPYVFGTRLREEMDRQEIKVACLSEMTGVNQRSILHYIEEPRPGKQTTMPTLRNAALIANALGVSLDYLAGLTDKPAADVEDSRFLTLIGLRREAADMLHALTKDWYVEAACIYKILCPWQRPFFDDCQINSRFPFSGYKYEVIGNAPTLSQILEGIFDQRNETILFSLIRALRKYLVLNRELALAENAKEKERTWMKNHPEAEIEFSQNGEAEYFSSLEKEERSIRFDLMCFGSDLLKNMVSLFPVPKRLQEAADQTADVNHELALRRSSRDIEYYLEKSMTEENFAQEEAADEPIWWAPGMDNGTEYEDEQLPIISTDY